MTQTNKAIANGLRKHRLRMGYEQTEVAYLLGHRSHTRVSQWENGLKKPSLENLLLLSFIYRTLPDELYYELRQELRNGFEKRLSIFESLKNKNGPIKTNDERTLTFKNKNVERK